MGSFRRKWCAGGLLLALGAAGCSKTSAPVAQVAPATTAELSGVAKVEPAPTKPDEPVVEPPKTQSPFRPVVPPSPFLPTDPKPETPKAPIAGVQPPVVPAKPVDPPKVDPVKPTGDAPKPTDPPTTPTDPPKEPKKFTYPKSIDGKDLAAWIKQLNPVNQPDPQQRELALKTIPQFGPDARLPSIAPITTMIYADGEDPGVRIVAITIITNIGYESREQIKPVVSALRTCLAKTGPGSIVRLYCVRSLMSFGPEAAAAIPEVKVAGSDSSWETRHAVATALGRLGSPPTEKGEPNDNAAKYLLNFLLKDISAVVRMEAIHALLMIGPPKPTKPEDYIKDVKLYIEPVEARIKIETDKGAKSDKGVLCWLYLLNIMYDDRVLPEHLKKIAKYIRFPDGPMVRFHALQACAALGPKAAPVVPEIMEALHYDEPELVIAAMSALAQIGTEARGAVEALEKIKAGSKDPKKPEDAPKDWKPDPTLRLVAEDALLYVTGKKKLGDLEPKKDK